MTIKSAPGSTRVHFAASEENLAAVSQDLFQADDQVVLVCDASMTAQGVTAIAFEVVDRKGRVLNEGAARISWASDIGTAEMAAIVWGLCHVGWKTPVLAISDSLDALDWQRERPHGGPERHKLHEYMMALASILPGLELQHVSTIQPRHFLEKSHQRVHSAAFSATHQHCSDYLAMTELAPVETCGGFMTVRNSELAYVGVVAILGGVFPLLSEPEMAAMYAASTNSQSMEVISALIEDCLVRAERDEDELLDFMESFGAQEGGFSEAIEQFRLLADLEAIVEHLCVAYRNRVPGPQPDPMLLRQLLDPELAMSAPVTANQDDEDPLPVILAQQKTVYDAPVQLGALEQPFVAVMEQSCFSGNQFDAEQAAAKVGEFLSIDLPRLMAARRSERVQGRKRSVQG